jgi:ribosome biogenesis GTPase
VTTQDNYNGIITRTDGQRIWVEAGGVETPCILRGRLKQERRFISTLAVIGDRVVMRTAGDGSGTIEEIAPRRSELARRVYFDQKWGRDHIMAANLDLLVNVQSAREPKFEPELAQRFLALAHHGRMAGAIVINKCDLADEAELLQAAEAVRPFGVPVIMTSAVGGRGLAELRALISGRLVALVGRSGAGKSSLINALFPGFAIRTQEVGQRTEKGRHTTTGSRLYPLPDGGYIADTPGLKDLLLFDAADEVAGAFPDIAELARGCRFADCRHLAEPDCAVKAAVAAGDLPEARYRAYLKAARLRR